MTGAAAQLPAGQSTSAGPASPGPASPGPASPESLEDRRTAGAPPRLWPYLAGTAAVALVVLVVVLAAAGGGPRAVPAGLPDAGAVTGWGLPVVRLVADLTAVLTVGLLLAAGVLLPARGRELGTAGVRCVRTATRTAALWAVTAAVEIVLTFSDFLGVPPAHVLDLRQLASFVAATTQGRALAWQALLAALVALAAAWTLTPRAAVVGLAGALAAVSLPALAGHSAAANDHMLATSSLLVHVVAASLWVGGLAALALVARRSTRPLLVAVPRFSALALWCVVAVGVSGVVNALLRLRSPADVIGTGYGVLVLAKVGALVALAWFGYLHRRRTLPTLGEADGRRVFARLAAVEVAVMATTVALAVGLSRTPTPVGDPDLADASPGRLLLGYPMPPPVTPERLLLAVRPDGFALTATALAAALYLTGVRVLRRRGDSWPIGRTAAWLAGLAVATLATSSGLGRYAPVLFSAHMLQHMTLNMVVPVLLVLGAPVTLALRTLPARAADGGRGPRDLVLAVVHSRAVAVLGHPLVAAGIFLTSLYGLYFTPLFAAAMRDHWGHLAMQAHFVLAGALFFWVIIGVDPGPRRPPYPLRMILLLAVMAMHAFFSVALMSTTTVLASDYFTALGRPWGGTPLDDQRLGGGIGWAFGELPTLAVLGALFVQWVRADERAARAADRAASRAEARSAAAVAATAHARPAVGHRADAPDGQPGGEPELAPAADEPEDEFAAYNRWLASLHARDGRAGTTAATSRRRDPP